MADLDKKLCLINENNFFFLGEDSTFACDHG